MEKFHTIADLCKHYRVRRFFVKASTIGIRNKGEVKWFDYSPVKGYFVVGQTKTPEGAEYRRVEG